MAKPIYYTVDEAEALLAKIREVIPEDYRKHGVLANVIAMTLAAERMSVSCCENYEQEKREWEEFKRAEDHLRKGWKHLRFNH